MSATSCLKFAGQAQPVVASGEAKKKPDRTSSADVKLHLLELVLVAAVRLSQSS